MNKNSTSQNHSQVEDALKESELRFRTIMMSIGDGVIATDTHGNIEIMNPVAEMLTGWKLEDALGKPLEEIFHIINEDTRQTVENPVRHVMREGEVIGLANHTLLIAKDGTEHPIADSGSPIRNENGDITGVVLVFRDQTNERMAQKTLQESREKYYYLYEYSPVGMYHTKIDGSGIIEINNSACEMLGFTKEELLGQASAIRWANPNRRSEILRIMNEYGVATNFDADIFKKDGSVISCLLSMKIFKEEGYIEGFIVDISERKQESEKFQKLMEGAPLPLCYVDKEGVITFRNDRFIKVFGYDHIDVPTLKEWWEKAYPDAEYRKWVLQNWESAVSRAAKTGTDIESEVYHVTCKDGTIREIIISGITIKDDFLATFVDITERVHAEEKVNHLASMVESSEDAIIGKTMDGIIISWNQGAEKVYGYTESEVIGKSISILIPSGNKNEMPVLLDKLKSGEYIEHYETTRLRKDGKEIQMSLSISPIRNIEGKIIAASTIGRDITERKQVEETIHASEARYRSYIDATGQIGWVTNASGEVVEDVPSLRKFSGQTYEEAKGSGWTKTIHPDDIERTIQIWNNAVATKSFYEIEYRMRRHDGDYRYMLARGFPVFKEDESIREWVGTCIDITERKRTEEEIKDNEKRFKELIESLPQLFWTCRVDGPCDYLSKQWVEYTGVPETEQLGYRWLEQLHDEDRDRTVSEWTEKVKTGTSFDIEFRIRRNDGLYRWFKTRAVPMHDSAGNITKWFGSNTDIDEIKKAEGQLRKLNRIYSLLSDINQAIVRTRVPKELFEKVCNISVQQGGFGMAWIGLVDETSQKLGVIAQAGRTNGYNEQINISLNGKPLSYCPIDSALRQGKHNICNIVENEEMAPCQKIAFDLGFRSSASFPLKVSDILKGVLTFYSDESDFFDESELKLLDELAMDISFAMEYAEKEDERKLAEETLHESEARYKTLVENIPQKILMKDINYRWISINENLARDFGFSPKEVVGKLDRDLFTKELADKYHADDMRIITTGKTEELEEKYMVDGKETWVNTIKTPVRDNKGEIVGLLGIFWDITGRKLAEEEIRKLNAELEDRVVLRTAQLEATNKELEAFSYSVSHDLRAPLRHVSGYVELLNNRFKSELAEKGQHYLASIADSVRIMGALIDDLLQFSRAGRTEMRMLEFDMNEVVKEVVESLTKDNPGRKIEWSVGKLPVVHGDEAMFRQVWINLLSNAVKFTRNKKKVRIEIGTKKENKELIFFVRDNGVGFDMQYAKKLFGVFQRLHPTEEFEGTGIGLANVQRIVLRHGGRTWAEAEPDKGAVFYFTLPKK